MRTEKILVIGGSAGSFRIITGILEILRPGFPYPVIICIHRLRNVRSGFLETFSLKTALPLSEPFDKEPIKKGNCYLAPANYHLLIENDRHFSLSQFKPVIFSRPSINLLFDSAADVYGPDAIGVLLSGANTDGADGIAAIHRAGGLTIVQDPSDAEVKTMPESALSLFRPDHVMDAAKITTFIRNLHS